MKEIAISSFDELEQHINKMQYAQALNGLDSGMTYFRGQGRSHYQLRNGLGRLSEPMNKIRKYEECLYDAYTDAIDTHRLKVVQDPYTGESNINKTWFQYIQAQHLGLPTRLMDWSRRWEIALMFAVENKETWDDDGQLFAFYCPREFIINAPQVNILNKEHPLESNHMYMINAQSYQPIDDIDNIAEIRRIRQQGIMFYQPIEKSFVPLEELEEFSGRVVKFIVKASAKEAIHGELNRINTEWAYYKEDEETNSIIAGIINKCDNLLRQSFWNRFLKLIKIFINQLW